MTPFLIRRIHPIWAIGIMLFVLFSTAPAVSADATSEDILRNIADRAQSFAVPGDESQPTLGVGAFSCLIGQPYEDGSMIIDCNTYDLQKLGSMGRQIILGSGSAPDRNVEFVWIHRVSSGVYDTRYESWSFDFGLTSSGTGGLNVGFTTSANQYPVITPRADGLAMVADNSSLVFLEYGRTRTFGNIVPGLAIFDGGDIPDSTWVPFDNGTPGFGDEFKWPQIAVKATGITEIRHMIIHNSNTSNTIGNNFLYTRNIGPTMTPSDNNWESARQFGWGGYHSAVIATSTNSNRVAIAFSGG